MQKKYSGSLLNKEFQRELKEINIFFDFI